MILFASASIAYAHADLTSCPETTGGQLQFLAGEPARFERAETFYVDVVAISAEATRIEASLVEAIRRRIPQWHREFDPAKADVIVQFHSGNCTDCSDCALPGLRPRWAFAEVGIDHGSTSARWSQATSSRSDKGLINNFVESLARVVGVKEVWCSVDGVPERIGARLANGFELTLLGQAKPDDQAPIAGARVRWRPEPESDGIQEWTEGTTDGRGHFSGPRLGDGSWDFQVCAPGYREIRGTVVVDQRVSFPDVTLEAIPVQRAAANPVTVLEPSSVVPIAAGTPVQVKWRILNGPHDPTGWQVRVSVLGCADDMGMTVIHTEPFKKSVGGFTWRASAEVVAWMRAGDERNKANGDESYYSFNHDLQLPIIVCLYNAGDRKRDDDFDESLTMFEGCRPFGDPTWIVCGSTDQKGPGRISTPPLRPVEARKRYEAKHLGVLQVAGEVTPPNLVDRVEPDWKDRGRHQPVTLEAVITTEGWVDDPIIVSSERPAVGRAALEALQRWKYEPATLDGKPVAVFVTVVLTP